MPVLGLALRSVFPSHLFVFCGLLSSPPDEAGVADVDAAAAVVARAVAGCALVVLVVFDRRDFDGAKTPPPRDLGHDGAADGDRVDVEAAGASRRVEGPVAVAGAGDEGGRRGRC